MAIGEVKKNEYRVRGHGLRRVTDYAIRFIGYAFLAIMIFILVEIFGYISLRGINFLSFRILTQIGDVSSGGLANSIVGTWMLVGIGLAISLPIGIFASIYISEYSSRTGGSILRLFTDLLTSIPSIILGFFGYLMLVLYLGWGYSLLAGGLVLGIMMLPYIIRISEQSLSNIPYDLREGGFALGASKSQVIFRLLLRKAKRGIMTSILLSVGIATGETAQLIYTAGFNNAYPIGLFHSQVAYLTYVVWIGIDLPSSYSHGLAFAAAFILVVTILVLILSSKYIKRNE